MRSAFTRRAAALLLTLSSLPLAAPTALAALPADAADTRAATYWGAHVGANTVDRLGAEVDLGGRHYPGEATLKHGVHGGVQFGRRTAHARQELEFESGSFRLTHLKAGPVNADANAHGRYRAVFANVYRTERLSDALEAYAGVGAGWGRTDLNRLGLLHACTCFGAASKAGFAWQLRAGAAFHIDERGSVVLQYSSLHLPALEAVGPPHVGYERKAVGAWTLGWIGRF